MELRAGYKNTEIGIIPDEWEVKKQKEIVRYINGRAYSLHEWEKKGIPVVRLQNLTKKGGNFYYSNLNLPDYQYMNKGDLIFMWSASFGPYIWWGNKAIFHYHIWKLECKKGKAVKDFYYFKLLEITEELKKGTSGSTMLHLTKGFMENYLISVPPLPEQTAIAKVLSDTDNLLQALEKKIAKKRLIKQGAMQELLKPKEGWVINTLGEIANFRRGSFPQPYGLDQWYDENNGMPFVQVFDVDKNMKLKPTTKQKISDLAKDKSVFVKKGNIILTIQGSIGRIAVTQYDSYVDRTLLIFTEYKIPMDIVFFSFIVQEKFRIEKENAPGGIIKTITKEALSKFKMVFPKSKEEQNKIATILSDMDTEIESLEKQLAKYKQVKQGLMQNLLTGKIRLV